MNSYCQYCRARKWKNKTRGMCCNGGKIQLLLIQPPSEFIIS